MISDDEKRVVGSIDASIPSADCFYRDEPAHLEMRADALQVATQVVDYGCALFQIANSVRAERRVRDLVVAALLRRAVISLEGVRSLVCLGLMEPALGLARTLQDVELSLKLVLRDETDRQAHSLAAWHYLQYQQHGQDMLGSHATREGPLTSGERVDEVRAIAKNYKALLDMPVFDAVRADVKAGRYWHGYDSIEAAFKGIGQESDYFMTYDTASWFVHGSNVEHDMVDGSGGQVTFRAFVERNPTMNQNVLGLALMKTLELYELVLSDKNVDVDVATGGGATINIDGREPERISALNALCAVVLREFDVRPDAAFRPVTP